MRDDPKPEFRCRCVFRRQYDDMGPTVPQDYHHRCPERATQEDGFCDHCRAAHAGTCTTCTPYSTTGIDNCCHPKAARSSARRVIADLRTPCLDAAVLA